MISTKLTHWTPKLLWLAVPSFGGAVLWWFIVAKVLAGRVGFSTAALPNLLLFSIFGIFACGLWLGAAGIGAYLAPRWSIRLMGAGLLTLPIVFFFPFSIWTVLAGLATVLALWIGLERVKADAQNRVSIRPDLTLGSALSLTITLVMVAVSLLYYQQLRGSTKTSAELSHRLSNQTVTVAERFIPLIYKDYRPDMTVDELISAQFPSTEQILADINFSQLPNPTDQTAKIREQLSQHGIDPDTFKVPPAATSDQVRTALTGELNAQRQNFIAEARNRLSEQLNVPIRGDEPARQVITALIDKQFGTFVNRYITVVPWLLAAALFFLLKIFTGVFQIVATAVGWAILRLYRTLHILILDHEMVPAETIDFVQ